jgi:hypothetical protein
MNRLFERLHRKSREKKYRLFQELLRPSPKARILNVGATGRNSGVTEQFETYYPYPERVIGGGLSYAGVKDYSQSFPSVRALIFDGCRLPFSDQTFDIVYSNAVLEHLPSREAQRHFANEVRRVGRTWFISTPNYWYPIEPHYHLPFIQFFPTNWQHRLARAVGKQPYPRLCLLSASRMKELFPGSRILTCRVTFYPETLVAVSTKNLSSR